MIKLKKTFIKTFIYLLRLPRMLCCCSGVFVHLSDRRITQNLSTKRFTAAFGCGRSSTIWASKTEYIKIYMCVFSNGIISALLCMTRLSQHIVVTMKVNCASHWPLSLWRDWICVMHGKYDARLYDYLPGLRWYSLITYSRSSIPALTGIDVQQLFWLRPVRCCLAKRHQQLLTCPKMQYVKILRNLFKIE